MAGDTPALPRVVLFGTPVLVCAGGDRPLPPNRRGQLLALLAVHGDWLRRDQLAGWLWPDHAQAAARVNLRNLLLRTRLLLRSWDAPALQEQGDALRWRVNSDWQAMRDAQSRGDWAACLAMPAAPLLQGLDAGSNDVLDALLRQLRGESTDLWRHAAEQQLATLTDDPAALADLSRLMLLRNPFDEDALVVRLQALRAGGQPGLAEQELRRYAQHLQAELGIAPSSRVRAVLQSQAVGAPGPAPPVPGFVGRLDDMMALRARLADPACRLLLLTGPGGVGKSMLAAAVVPSLAPRYPDGVHWIRVEELTDEEAVVQRLRALWQLPGGDAQAQIARFLAPRRLLLVLDGAEHLPALGGWLEPMLAAAPAVQLLVTTRRLLTTPSAQRMVLRGLSMPGAAGAAGDAVALFEARARRADPHFALQADDAAVRRIVSALEGLPLAIELAASWVSMLPPAQIAEQVTVHDSPPGQQGRRRSEMVPLADSPSDPLVLVDDATGGGPPGLRASVSRSWALLNTAQRRALARLAWLPGAFMPAMALRALDVPLPMLRSLADASLLQSTGDGRFALHALVRAVVRERARRERAGVQRRHARWMAAWAAPSRLTGAAHDALFAADWHHVAAAWRWALDARDAGTLEALAYPLRMHFAFAERTAVGLRWLTDALAAMPDTLAARSARGQVTVALADLQCRSGDLAAASTLARQALRLATPLRDRALARAALHVLGFAAHRGGHFVRADRYWQQTLRLAREMGDGVREAVAVNALAVNAMAGGRHAQALSHFEHALALDRAQGAPPSTLAMRLNNLGTAAYDQRQYDRACRWLDECLAIARAADLSSVRSTAATTLAMVLTDLGRLDAARVLAAEAVAAAEVTGQAYEMVLATAAKAHVAWRRGEPEPARAALQQVLMACTGDGPATQQATLQLMALTNVAEWLSTHGDATAAAALAWFVQKHPACFATERLRVQALFAGLVASPGRRRPVAAMAAGWSGDAGQACAAALRWLGAPAVVAGLR